MTKPDRLLLSGMANSLHNDAVIRMSTKKNNIKLRLLAIIPFWIKLFWFAVFFSGFYFQGFLGYELNNQR